MPRAVSLLPFALLLTLPACGAGPTSTDPGDREAVAWRPVAARAAPLPTDEQSSPNVRSSLPPGTRIELQDPPRASRGIPVPGAACLPALNGVAESGAIDRPAEHGAVPAVTGVLVDDQGFEWYEHQDGSLTTTKFVWQQAQHRWAAVTMHAVAPR